jgi:hypothetical protein
LSPYSWDDDPVDTNDDVDNIHVNQLRITINVEYARRSKSGTGCWDIGTKANGDTIYGDDWQCYRDNIDNAKSGWSIPAYLQDPNMDAGEEIEAQQMNAMRDRIDVLRAECICNCNYSCTCNCNYCVCDCNHTCKCNCNYSDERLKEEITYI